TGGTQTEPSNPRGPGSDGPSGKTSAALTGLVPLSDCGDVLDAAKQSLAMTYVQGLAGGLAALLEQHASECAYYTTGSGCSGHSGPPMPMWNAAGAVDDSATPRATAESGSGSSPSSTTKTNNQVAGVDEADIVKVDDGSHIYVIADDKLNV